MDIFIQSDAHLRFENKMKIGSPVMAKSLLTKSVKTRQAAYEVNDLITSGIYQNK